MRLRAAFSVAGARDWPPTRPGIDFLLVVLGDTLSNATAARVALRVRETVSQGRFHLSSALGKEDVPLDLSAPIAQVEGRQVSQRHAESIVNDSSFAF